MNEANEGIISEVDAALSALNDRQRTFVELVVAGVPQSEAVKRAGYAHKHAASTASHLRREPKIERALSALGNARKDVESVDGLELVEKRLLELSATGTPAARVSALGALQRLYESQSRARSSEVVLENLRNMPEQQRETEIFERFARVLTRIGTDPVRRDRVRERAMEIRDCIDQLYAS